MVKKNSKKSSSTHSQKHKTNTNHKHSEVKKPTNDSKINFEKKMVFWQIISGILLVLLVVLLLTMNGSNNKMDYSKDNLKDTSSCDSVANETVSFLETNLGVTGLSILGSQNANDLCEIDVSYQDQELTIHTSENGEMIFLPGSAPINKAEFESQDLENQTTDNTNTQDNQATQVDLEKTAIPKVELFVMSHCPYGTQMEKAMLPVVEKLGDKIDFELKFVYYAMHGEKELEEQVNQYCIQENQEDKFNDYLSCFLENGESEKCLDQTGIDRNSLESCATTTYEEYNVQENFDDQSSWVSGKYPLFDLHKEDNEKYNVRGSPTLVINGSEVSVNRTPQAILDTVCQSFTDKPSECDSQLSTQSPSPGFGYQQTANAAPAAQCS